MKLYANVASDRASKGQGGNKFIRIELLAGSVVDQHDAGLIELVYTKLEGKLNEYDEAEVRYFPPSSDGYQVLKTLQIPRTKGNKRKTASQ